MRTDYDIAVIGSGFAGSLLAMIARRAGRSVVLLEKGRHPRFAIGESTTPLGNLLLEEIATKYNLPALTPLTKWGTWQGQYPQMTCGLKRGFTFFSHASCTFTREEQLLVAASANNATSDTHWYRAELDEFLVREAQGLGVEYFDQVNLHQMTECANGVKLAGERFGNPVKFRAKFLVDATGPRGFVHKALNLAETSYPNYPQTEALYSHFSGVGLFGNRDGVKTPPYPVDDAALHHVFDGGWIWVLRFNNGLTSAGVAATRQVAYRLQLTEGAAAWTRLLDTLPAVKEQFSSATPQRSFVHSRRLPFLSGEIARSRWALLPSAAGFVDPLLSTGFPLTLLGVARLAEVIDQDWGTSHFEEKLVRYAGQTCRGAMATARLIGALYAAMGNFPLFVSLSMLYFVAASFAESTGRLNKAHLTESFLLCDDPVFGPACASLCQKARYVKPGRQSAELGAEIMRAIQPFNIAHFGKPNQRNWYPIS